MIFAELQQSFLSQNAVFIVGAVGFLAAVTLGSIAWYNSRRPIGWQEEERPDYLPDLDSQS